MKQGIIYILLLLFATSCAHVGYGHRRYIIVIDQVILSNPMDTVSHQDQAELQAFFDGGMQ